MAESISKLMLRIGLSFDELNKDFVQAEGTLKSNMERLGRENALIKLKAQVDLSSVTDATERLKIQQEALNKQIELQRSRLQLTNVAWKEASQSHGEHSKQAQQTAIAIEREKLKLIELEQELKKITDQQKATANVKPNNLLNGYNNIKGNISGKLNEISTAFSGISTASQSADGAITKSLEIIESIPHPVGKAVAAIGSIPLVFKGIENSIIETAKAAAAAGDSVYVMSRGFQMSVADTAKFATNCKVAGVEVNDLASTVKRLQQSILRSGRSTSSVSKMLQRYGVSIYDANGHLKNLNDMTMALSQGLKRAQAEGNGAAFVLTAFRNASGDAITAIEDWADVNEQAATIVKNGLANPALSHQVQGNINAMNQQAAQLNASFNSVFLKAANEIIPHATQRMGEMTRYIADNKEAFEALGSAIGKVGVIASDVLDFFATGAAKVTKTVGSLVQALSEFSSYQEKQAINLYVDDKSITNATELMKKELQRMYSFTERAAIENNPVLYQQTLAHYEPMFKALEEARAKTKEAVTAIGNEINKNEPFSLGGISAQLERDLNTDVFDAKIESLRKVRDLERETNSILYKIDHDSYESRKHDLEDWWHKTTETQQMSEEVSIAYEKQYHAKLQQLEKEHQDEITRQRESTESKIKEITQSTADIEFSLTHTAFEKQLRDIEQWKEAQLSKREYAEYTAEIIANAAAKEAEAFEREVERIKGLTQSLEDEIFEMEHSQYEADKRRVMQKAQKALDEGVNPATVQRYLQDKLGQLSDRAAKGGDYVKSPTSGRGSNPYLIEFGGSLGQRNIGLFADENNIRQRLNQQLSGLGVSTQKLTNAQDLLIRSMQSGFETLQGTKSNIIEFRQELEQPRPMDYKTASSAINPQMPNYQELVARLLEHPIQKLSGGAWTAEAGGGADLANFIHSFDNLGVDFSQISAYLEDIRDYQRQRASQEKPVNTIAPNITVNVTGNIVADQRFEQEMAEKIEQRVTGVITQAVNTANTQNNLSYAS